MQRSKNVLCVLTRDGKKKPDNGHDKSVHFILEVVENNFNKSEYTIDFLLSRPIFGAISCFVIFLVHLLKGRFLPLQVLLFSKPSCASEIVKIVVEKKIDTVYLDGIRTYIVARHLSKTNPEVRLVMDLEDLMSRRWKYYSDQDVGISFGYLENSIHPIISKVAQIRPITVMLRRYEAWSLKRLEKDVLGFVDAVTLVSAADGNTLISYTGDGKAGFHKVQVIPPVVRIVRKYQRNRQLIRFIFIGSDFIWQNRFSIEFLLDLWRRVKPSAQLNIYGNMLHKYNLPGNVVMHGYVESLSEVYTDSSIALCSSFVTGGIKTKVIESLSRGCLVAGNELTFEGIDIPDNTLIFDETDLEQLIRSPQEFLDRLEKGYSELEGHCQQFNSEHVVQDAWKNVISG